MKKYNLIVFIGILLLGVSCKKALDINTDPNRATSATPELILPQALTGTAAVVNGYNTYGSETGLYAANAGGYGGFGEAITYNYTTSFTGLWSSTYDNLEDYQAIINYTSSQLPLFSNYNAAAKIMKVYGFQLLVDAFNNIPYSEALKGADNLTPKYDDAKAIYLDLAKQLDTAIATIRTGMTTTGTVTPLGSKDVLFGGDMASWLKFANTLKLRLMIRAKGKVTFANTSFDAAGFLTTDALVNPGYTRDNGRQNPAWNNWAYTYTGTAATKSWMPSKFIFGFYHGESLTDDWRGRAIYYLYDSDSTGINRLGYENNSLVSNPIGGFWYSGTNRDGKSNGDTAIGILKGPGAGFPLLLASESYFLQAEGQLNGIITGGDVATLFDNGMLASFTYLFETADNKTLKGSPTDSLAAYKTANTASKLVNFSFATTPAQQLEAIITQKYIALNFIHGHEGWNEYRRTHYPTIVTGGTDYQTFSSTVSESTRADKLPTRILYPVSESNFNTENVPSGISPFTSTIFWAL